MTQAPRPALQTSGDPGEVWRVGFAPNPWAWTPWEYAGDAGRFNGRWDDEQAVFRTLYTSESLLGCFLEVLAPLRPNSVAFAELAEIEDDGAAVSLHADPEPGAVGFSWLSDRLFGRGLQTGTYAEVTRAESIGFLQATGIFDRLGIPASRVDASLLKDPRSRKVTRTVARFLFDQYDEQRRPFVDGVAFRSRMGDELRMWAVFERTEAETSEHVTPDDDIERVAEDIPELLEAFRILGLHWRE
jgi:hypothetical protein